MEWVLRPPAPEDADALGALHVHIWEHAYRGLLRDDLLDQLDVDARVRRWQTIGETVDPHGMSTNGHCAIAAYANGLPVGMAGAAIGNRESPTTTNELLSLNVAPEWHGTGVAAALMGAVLPTGAAFLWVLTENVRAIAFYRNRGFETDGTSRYDPDWDCVDLRMRRPGS